MERIERRSFELSSGDGTDVGSRKIVGYPVVFDSESVDLGGFIEVVKPGAFTNTLKNYPDIKALCNHVSGQSTLGRTGVNLTLKEDDKGLYCELDLTEATTTVANDVLILVRTRIVPQCSFGFIIKPNGSNWVDRGEDTLPLRELIEIEQLLEISISVTFPAYEGTNVDVREIPDFKALRAEQAWLHKLDNHKIKIFDLSNR